MQQKIIKRKNNYDSMWISAKLPSGAYIKYHLNRNGETIDLRFSNDTNILAAQSKIIQEYMQLRKGETNQHAFDRLETLLNQCNSGKEVIDKILFKTAP